MVKVAGVLSFAQMKLVQRRRKRTAFIRKLICSALCSQAKLLESAKWFVFATTGLRADGFDNSYFGWRQLANQNWPPCPTV